MCLVLPSKAHNALSLLQPAHKVQVVLVLVYLWIRFEPAVLSALTVVVLLMPTQVIMGRLFSRLRRKTAVHTDKRVKVMNEIITGIRIIKLYCWEKPFGRLVNSLRRDEVRQLRRTRRVQACVLGPYYTTSQASIFLLTLTFVLTDREAELRPATVFLLMGVIQGLRLTCGLFVPVASQFGAEAWVAVKRIQAFLCLEEHTKATDSNGTHADLSGSGDCVKVPPGGVKMMNVTAKWDGSPEGVTTLDDISLSVSTGQLVAVIGPVGSGKTSLLMTLLGELPVQSGSVRAQGKIAYVSQHPWIFSGSLRQNILFGEPLDKARYDKIIRISALSRDLTILPNGDATLIGDRGVTLSGGQRARVSLARALYMDADIYLLDDPLAAVDTAVGRHIFEKCIVKYLKDKPRILVTHQVQLLPVADNIVILTDPDAVQTHEEEERATGSVELDVYTSYFRAGAGVFLLTIFVVFVLSADVFFVLSDWWLARWTNQIEDRHSALEAASGQMSSTPNNTTSSVVSIPEVDTYFNLYVYTGTILGLLVVSLIRALLFFKIAVKAGETLHNRMFARILRATMSFFDTNPVGRVLNRFSKDTGQIDDLLPWTMFDMLQNALQAAGVVIVAAVFNPWVLIPAVPIILLFVFVRRYYVQTSRSVKRLEGTTRSPVFSYLSASLQGLHTIRAMHIEDRLVAEFDAHQDLHSEAWYLFLTTSRWLGVRLDSLSVAFVACVVYLSVFASSSMDVGYVGLTVIYTINLTGLFQWTVRQSVEMENQMISVERVLQYSRLPVEAGLESKPENKPADDWPTSGSLQAKDVRLQYSPSAPFVLRDISFDIHSGEKVELKEAITSHPEHLYMEVTEGGSNFSAGQRQLMCLARAVLGNTRILMIDEATANVDPITDELIQQTIRTKFKVCTVLTIAHRLHTIIDSDRIMVLDAGRIVEMDSPKELLAKVGNGGVFYSMVEQLGQAERDHLIELAAGTRVLAELPASTGTLTEPAGSTDALTEPAASTDALAEPAASTDTLSDSRAETSPVLPVCPSDPADDQGVKPANQESHLEEPDGPRDMGQDNEAFEPENTRL
ncbi:ABC transporter C family member 5 [Elysia marginata]|uniref:ABC transporter C family member 5 n=1 Tax=Elysia marginata TaxID=1093978 RepID=A0AAV4IXW9_9GAST|nr:ABC transporter C family member 5 [Elysia marginata]